MPLSRACATGLRTKTACSSPGISISSTNRPRPRNRLASSRRGTERPIQAPVASLIVDLAAAAMEPSLSLHLSHDRAPLGEFLFQVLVRSLRSIAEHGFKTGFNELLLKGLVRPLLLGDIVELLEHRFRRAGGREDAEEDLRDETRQSLLARRRNLGRSLEPRRRIHGEDADFAGTMQFDHLRGDVGKDDADLSAEQIVHRRRNAAIRHVQDIESAGALLEQLGGDVGDGADSARAIRQLAGMSFYV